MEPRITQKTKAFSLIEVTISIGLAAFGIVSMIGLMGSLLNTNREAGEKTVIAAMVRTVSGELRPRPFDAPASGPDNSLAALVDSGITFYFGQDGVMTPTAEGALYSCRVTLTPDRSLTTPTTLVENRYDAALEFRWPHPANTSSKTFHISLARYAN